MDEMTLTLNSPLTDEQWDAITDVDFDNTNEIYFHTKHGKEVYFVKRKTGNWKVFNILDHAQRPTGRKILQCPFCEYRTGEIRSMVDFYHKLTNFCPNCGSDMRKETEDVGKSDTDDN